MSIGTITLIVALAAGILTFAQWRRTSLIQSPVISFFQNFTGILFLFSGWVKAVDPMGTAYKMEQYFAEFEATFADTALSFLAPLFPLLADASVGFAVGMIVLELVLGLMLLLGTLPKLTAWAFFLLVAFFTVLTGFTYLTGFVPEGVNFFSFAQWSEFKETHMKVTDCGCFGDFIKLKPQVSFAKDVFLLIPAILFLLRTNDMHQLLTAPVRKGLTLASLPVFLLYCFSNYVWALPHSDFRPFKEGVNIAEQKQAEADALANIEILGFRAVPKGGGEPVELSYDDYMSRYSEFPEEEWEIEQIQSEPEIEPTKISEFEISHMDGYDITEDLLTEPGYLFLIVAHELKGKETVVPHTVKDTIYSIDTLEENGAQQFVRRVKDVAERQMATANYDWEESYLDRWAFIRPVLAKAQEKGMQVAVVSRIASPDKLQDFIQASGLDAPIYQADDILLKTIIRSNPGIVLLKEGTILKKWHYLNFPGSLEEVMEAVE